MVIVLDALPVVEEVAFDDLQGVPALFEEEITVILLLFTSRYQLLAIRGHFHYNRDFPCKGSQFL